MSCTILYYILSLCLYVLSIGFKDLKYNFFIVIFIYISRPIYQKPKCGTPIIRGSGVN